MESWRKSFPQTTPARALRDTCPDSKSIGSRPKDGAQTNAAEPAYTGRPDRPFIIDQEGPVSYKPRLRSIRFFVRSALQRLCRGLFLAKALRFVHPLRNRRHQK